MRVGGSNPPRLIKRKRDIKVFFIVLAYFAVWRMYRRAAVAPNWGFHPRSNKKVINLLPNRVPLAPNFFLDYKS